MFAQVYLVAFTLAFAQFAFAASCARSYTVKKGDICDTISQVQSVSTYQLSVTNPKIINKGCSNLEVGEVICLGFVGEDCSTTHTVKTGDTCQNIAAANGLNMTLLRMNNPQLDQACDIYDGEVLCTSKTVQVPPVPAGGLPNATPMSKSNPPPSSESLESTSTSGKSVPTVTFPKPSVIASVDNGVKQTPTPIEHTPAPLPTVTDSESGLDSEDDLPFCDEL